MKLFIKLMVLILVIGLAGPFIIRAPNGRPYLDVGDFIPSWAATQSRMKRWWNNLSARSSDEGDIELGSGQNGFSGGGKTRVYRWRDEENVWRYSDTPPAGVEVETLWLDPTENVVIGNPSAGVREVAEDQDSTAPEPGFRLPLPLTVAPEEVPQLIEDARQVQELLQQRNEMLESVSGESRQ